MSSGSPSPAPGGSAIHFASLSLGVTRVFLSLLLVRSSVKLMPCSPPSRVVSCHSLFESLNKLVTPRSAPVHQTISASPPNRGPVNQSACPPVSPCALPPFSLVSDLCWACEDSVHRDRLVFFPSSLECCCLVSIATVSLSTHEMRPVVYLNTCLNKPCEYP